MVSLLNILISSFLLVTLVICNDDDFDIKDKIQESLEGKENFKNVIKVFGLNVNGFDKEQRNEKLCEVIEEMVPSIVGLQQLGIPEVMALKQCFQKIKKCSLPNRGELRKKKRSNRRRKHHNCGSYKMFGAGSSFDEETTFFNPVIFRRRRGLRILDSNGTFWLSKTPNVPFTKIDDANGFHVCSWVKLRYAVDTRVQKHKVHIQNLFFDTLVSVLTKKVHKKRITKWVDFYFLNTHLDENLDVAMKQMKIILKHLNQNILPGNSNVPVILTGGSKAENLPHLFQLMAKEGFENSMTTARNVYQPNKSTETFIWVKEFTSLVSNGESGDLGAQVSALLFK